MNVRQALSEIVFLRTELEERSSIIRVKLLDVSNHIMDPAGVMLSFYVIFTV